MFTIISNFISGIIGKFKIYLIIGAVVAALLGVCIWYFHYSQNKISELNATIAKLEIVVKLQDDTIKKLNDVIVLTQKASDELNKKFNIIEEDAAQLAKKFSQHDLNNLAAKKPGLIQKLANDGTKQILTFFETISK